MYACINPTLNKLSQRRQDYLHDLNHKSSVQPMVGLDFKFVFDIKHISKVFTKLSLLTVIFSWGQSNGRNYLESPLDVAEVRVRLRGAGQRMLEPNPRNHNNIYWIAMYLLTS